MHREPDTRGSGPFPPLRARLLSALVIGVAFGVIVYANLARMQIALAWDFSWAWRAARALVEGLDPYIVIQPTGGFPFDAPFKYPLPAALVALPLARVQPWVAGGIFAGISVGLLAFALTREGWWRLIILASAPFLLAASAVQWSPLITAAALLPVSGALVVAKPTIGLALFAAWPRRGVVFGGILLCAVGLLLLPRWPVEWLQIVLSNNEPHYRVPITTTLIGPFLLLAMLRWRTSEGRLLFAMACVPQTLVFYDQLPLLLIPRTSRELQFATLCSQLGYAAAEWQTRHGSTWGPIVSIPWCMASCYLPALIIVLRHPNDGTLPPAVERLWSRCNALLPRAIAMRGR